MDHESDMNIYTIQFKYNKNKNKNTVCGVRKH